MRTIGNIKIPENDSYRVQSTFNYGKFRMIAGNRNDERPYFDQFGYGKEG